MENFNLYLLQAVLSNNLEDALKEVNLNVTSVKFTPTILPTESSFFAKLEDVKDKDEYLKYIVAASRLDISFRDNSTKTFYVYLRNKRSSNRAFVEPSSIEFGDVQDHAFNRIYKAHYSDFNSWSTANTKANVNVLLREIAQDVIGALADKLGDLA